MSGPDRDCMFGVAWIIDGIRQADLVTRLFAVNAV